MEILTKINIKFPNSETIGGVEMQKIRLEIATGQNIKGLRNNAKLTWEQTIARLQLMSIEVSKVLMLN